MDRARILTETGSFLHSDRPSAGNHGERSPETREKPGSRLTFPSSLRMMPVMQLPTLPVSSALERINQALSDGHLVLEAPPGSGKTTLVPLALMQAAWLDGKKILMLEPRRPAARMAAHRMASLLGQEVGDQVGYQVRFERRIGRNTQIEVLTEGLLLRRLQQDPELSGVGLVIFDEFHERGINGDLSLALCLDAAAALREDLRLMLMSASLDGRPLAERIGASHLQAEGQSYPVSIEYLARDPVPQERQQVLARLVRHAFQSHPGDLLVFLPGRGEIEFLARTLRGTGDFQVLALHSGVGAREQDAIISGKSATRRVILSTDIAETSLTIDGIGVVIDSGLNRKPRFDPGSGLTRLQTGFVSRASALQRAGRAGRLGPGHCYRAWSESRQQRLEAEIRPEILDADLAPSVLEVAAWGIQGPTGLPWITAPPEGHWHQAQELLMQLGALDPQARITVHGKRMLALPIHPRLAHLLSEAEGEAALREAADIAALLSERDPMKRPSGSFSNSDIRTRLDGLASFRAGQQVSDFDQRALQQIDRAAQQLRKLLPRGTEGVASPVSPGLALAKAYPDRIARARHPRSRDYLLRNGRAASLPEGDLLSGQEYLVVASLDAGSQQGKIWLAAPITREEVLNHFSQQITDQRELCWDDEPGAVRAVRRQRLGALVLREQATRLEHGDDITPILLQQVRNRGLDIFEQASKLRQLQAKVGLLRERLEEQEWPALDDENLLQDLDTWLSPWLDGITSLTALRAIDLQSALSAYLGWERQQRLDELLPDDYRTPAGTSRKIEYAPGEEPVLRVPLQEMLGETQGPAVAHRRIPLVLHLLSPAMRPIQITRDLGHFWRNAYTEVRKEMRGRYPKHHWPEDPLNAHATVLGRRGKPGQ